MSVVYEQRKALVVEVLIDHGMASFGSKSHTRVEVAEAILDALDHIPEKLDWVCEGQPRDQVTKGVS